MPNPPQSEDDFRRLIRRRHPEWNEFGLPWRKALDAYEGGNRYRNAIYGFDNRGQPIRNLVRHKREYPDPREANVTQGMSQYATGAAVATDYTSPLSYASVDEAQFATDSDYELRRARTPVPTFVREAVDDHLGTVYEQEVSRKGPDDLMEWWDDVDGQGTNVDDWIMQTVAPLFLVCGQVDVLIDHPPAPEGVEVASEADRRKLELDRAVASVVQPTNVLWWVLNPDGSYQQVLVREFDDDSSESHDKETERRKEANPDLTKPSYRYRYWDAERCVLLNAKGEVVSTHEHGFGRVPIVRVFDRRNPRCRNVGMSRYTGIVERQREYYNRDSELILSDTVQAHPLLQGPEDFVQADGTIPIGPAWLLPKKKHTQGSSVTYEGFDVVDFPKDGADSLRRNKDDIREEVDRDASLAKPAGASGQGRGTVAQSGVSKSIDMRGAHRKMSQIARSLARLEATLAELALAVLRDGDAGEADFEAVEIGYPTTFDLDSGDELTDGLTSFQLALESAGEAPDVETRWLQKIVKTRLPGLEDAVYDQFDAEIMAAVAAKAKAKGMAAEGLVPQRAPMPEGDPAGNAGLDAGEQANRFPEYSPYPGYPVRPGMGY